jgi:thiamine-monophosphate kinase
MIDLSDGLGSDLPRLARASNVGFEIEVRSLPRSSGATIRNAISDGEDYELLFAISPGESTRLQRAWKKKFPKVPLTCIGRFVSRSAVRARSSRVKSKLNGGYVHFQ